MIRSAVLAATLAALFAGPAPALAQSGQFAPRLIVNDRAITNYEVEQRIRMLQLFNAPGDPEEEAVKGLIEDRLRLSAAKELGLKATPEQILAGMEEFASRANLTAEQFVEALGQNGVSAQSFRDFVEAGLVWREVIRQRFGPSAIITDEQIDRAIATSEGESTTRVLISELVIPYSETSKSSILSLATRIRDKITSETEFSTAARSYSSAATKGNGGKLDWLPLTSLPPEVATALARLSTGQTTQPLDLGTAYGMFQLRGREEAKGKVAPDVSVEYALFSLPAGSAAEAAKIRTNLDKCDDLYGVAEGLPADRLLRETRAIGALPADIGAQISRLDVNETVDFPRAGAHVVLMLCSRNPQAKDFLARSGVREQLLNQRLTSRAETYLEELRANAIIREP